MPKLSTTWLMISARVGFTPIAMITIAGAIVMPRRSHSGMRRLMKPSMITCPASVPTLLDERPEASSASAKRIGAELPRIGPSRAWTWSRSTTSVRPRLWNAAAATISIDMLTRPAIDIAITTSMRSKRISRRRSSSLRPLARGFVSAECR